MRQIYAYVLGIMLNSIHLFSKLGSKKLGVKKD